jgi:hypothetical protein
VEPVGLRRRGSGVVDDLGVLLVLRIGAANDRPPRVTGWSPAVWPSRWGNWIAAPPPVSTRRRRISPLWIFSWMVLMAWMSVSGPGGHPGAYASTGTIWSTPWTIA